VVRPKKQSTCPVIIILAHNHDNGGGCHDAAFTSHIALDTNDWLHKAD
jgi:hypothetical protein